MRFLIDVNLPYRFALWSGEDFAHMRDIGERWSDTEIWRYARECDLVIVTKDADFSDRALIAAPPPRVVHFRVGNLKMRDFFGLVNRTWPGVVVLCPESRLIRVYADRIEAIG